MNNPNHNEKVILINISDIKIINPRVRNKFTHEEITSNINAIGLKRPIVVRKIDDEKYLFALVCGQGRLESYVMLKQSSIPAIVKDVDDETGYIMSLVENIARRKPRATEQLEEVRALKKKGLSDSQIGDRLGYSANWVNSITLLLDKGERRLLSAVESGHLPLYLAVEIARSSDSEIQGLLIEAFNEGKLKGRQISIVRSILDRREVGNKGSSNKIYTSNKNQKKMTSEELLDVYQSNVKDHKQIFAKSEFAKNTLMLTNEIISQLLKSKSFVSLLSKEGINSIPSEIINNSGIYRDAS
ncbi:ParB/RepB/Spo0J family partition protein [Serratia fonticola]|uniref:ParB/RepB/Spo0J family partition protein n=1 Tax=Serratia fonticola TaxID=47917 RepID=UPI00192A7C71|nr:plasmid partitioning protein RepB C-terminal domain-containing protein [Serratia fonticola]MBL5906126.1 ParB N-terminal domain-containing protein [Serratia fonticola]